MVLKSNSHDNSLCFQVDLDIWFIGFQLEWEKGQWRSLEDTTWMNESHKNSCNLIDIFLKFRCAKLNSVGHALHSTPFLFSATKLSFVKFFAGELLSLDSVQRGINIDWLNMIEKKKSFTNVYNNLQYYKRRSYSLIECGSPIQLYIPIRTPANCYSSRPTTVAVGLNSFFILKLYKNIIITK